MILNQFPKALLLLVLFQSSSLAFDKDFPPYPKGKLPPTCQIHTLKAVSETDRNKGDFKSLYQLKDQPSKLVLHLDMNYQKQRSGMYARLDNDEGKVLVKPTKIGGHPSNINHVFWAFLNKDNRKDFIISMDGGDGYLSAGRQTVSFILSTKDGYQLQQLSAYSAEQEDFYDYSTDKKCEYLHQTLVSETGKGGENYWVYNVLQFIDGKIVIKNQLSRYFPKWIKLTLDPNDNASTLTKKQLKVFSHLYKEQVYGN